MINQPKRVRRRLTFFKRDTGADFTAVESERAVPHSVGFVVCSSIQE